jgi:hypothetical protein
MKYLFEEDPVSGVRKWFEGDGKGGFTLVTEQAFPIGNVDMVKTLKDDTGAERWKGYVNASSTFEKFHYAHIPGPVLAMLAARGVNIYDVHAMMQVVNSDEFCYLRSVDPITHGIPENKDDYKDAGEAVREAGVIK